MGTRYELPQPYEEVDHTADVGLLVRGQDPCEVLARLLLALGALMAGGGEVRRAHMRELEVPAGTRVAMALDLLRAQLIHFALEHEIVGAVEVVAFEPTRGARVLIETGPYDPVAHLEGGELKAVTLHGARFEEERASGGWMAQVILDV
jgi:SHS2 domain-containing protein